jgi:hypothetical protein
MQDSETDPAVLWFEVDDENRETRKVDEYGDGRLDFAPADPQIGSTWLADKNDLMPVDEMNDSGEFEAREISREEFEVIWRRSLGRHGRPV